MPPEPGEPPLLVVAECAPEEVVASESGEVVAGVWWCSGATVEISGSGESGTVCTGSVPPVVDDVDESGRAGAGSPELGRPDCGRDVSCPPVSAPGTVEFAGVRLLGLLVRGPPNSELVVDGLVVEVDAPYTEEDGSVSRPVWGSPPNREVPVAADGVVGAPAPSGESDRAAVRVAGMSAPGNPALASRVSISPAAPTSEAGDTAGGKTGTRASWSSSGMR